MEPATMTPFALGFMSVSFTAVISLTVWCLWRILRSDPPEGQ